MAAVPNIWVAAADNMIPRVEFLLQTLAPDVKDENGYTPVHAAASYGHLDLLQLLLDRGANINVQDNEGDTPLYTVESVPTARYLVERGAQIAIVNHEGVSPIDHLAEDFPEVANYLSSVLDPAATIAAAVAIDGPSQYAQNQATEQMVTTLLQDIQSLQHIDPTTEAGEQQLREVVSRNVLAGLELGHNQGQGNSDIPADSPAKRPKPNEGP